MKCLQVTSMWGRDDYEEDGVWRWAATEVGDLLIYKDEAMVAHYSNGSWRSVRIVDARD